ncbi:MAG: hypothetical protein M0R06_10375 [Sphaerochaeta sp.]|jgi:hypothetical protein|nr:hypothetical protein [Sphaerochaeta sp.]
MEMRTMKRLLKSTKNNFKMKVRRAKSKFEFKCMEGDYSEGFYRRWFKRHIQFYCPPLFALDAETRAKAVADAAKNSIASGGAYNKNVLFSGNSKGHGVTMSVDVYRDYDESYSIQGLGYQRRPGRRVYQVFIGLDFECSDIAAFSGYSDPCKIICHDIYELADVLECNPADPTLVEVIEHG